MQTPSKHSSLRIDWTSRVARRTLLVPLSLALAASSAAATREFKWDELKKQGRSLLPVIRRRYEEIELRTMRAHDVGRR